MALRSAPGWTFTGVRSNTQNTPPAVTRLAVASNDDGFLRLAREAIEPLGIEILSPADVDFPASPRSGRDLISAATSAAAGLTAATALPSIGFARAFVIDPFLRLGGGGPRWRWPVPWSGTNEELTRELLEADDALVRGGYCGPDDRDAFFHTVICLLWPNAESWTFEGRMEGQFASLTRQRMKSRGFLPLFADCFVPKGESDVIGRLGALEAWSRDQQSALGTLVKALSSS